MSLPAALTWLQLLPRATRFECARGGPGAPAAPEWFENMLRAHAGDGSGDARAAIVAWGRTWLESDEQTPAIVGINSPMMHESLESLGYTCFRRFAVLPSLEKARWFIPLGSGAVAEAAFSLYTPSRRSARLKKAVAKRMARWRVPGWYRDEVVIASRQPPPLEVKLAELFAGRTIRLALSSGAPEPAINRKPSAAVIDATSGEVLAFAKVAVSDVSRRIIENEAHMLRALQERDHLRALAPRLLFAGEVDGRYVTVQSPLPGRPAGRGFTVPHFAFIYTLRGADKIAAETNMVATLRPRLAALDPARPDLVEIFDALLPTLERMTVNSTVVHGDFAPWNLREHEGTIAAFDWEYGEIDGLPRIDEMHFRLQQGLELENWSTVDAAAYLREMDDGEGGAEMRAVQAVYLLDHLARLLDEGYGQDHDIVSLYQELLTGLNVARREAALV